MASVVIVTSQCYLLADAINYIVINEVDDSDDKEWQPKSAKARKIRYNNKVHRQYVMERKPYAIQISFIPKVVPQSNNPNSHHGKSRDDSTVINITVHGLQLTLRMFTDIVSQLREQLPDEAYLDQMVEKFLTDTDLSEEELVRKLGPQ